MVQRDDVQLPEGLEQGHQLMDGLFLYRILSVSRLRGVMGGWGGVVNIFFDYF